MQIIGSLKSVLDHMLNTEKEMTLSLYTSVPPTVIHIIQSSYMHCKVILFTFKTKFVGLQSCFVSITCSDWFCRPEAKKLVAQPRFRHMFGPRVLDADTAPLFLVFRKAQVFMENSCQLCPTTCLNCSRKRTHSKW